MSSGRGAEAEKDQTWWTGYRTTVVLLCTALFIVVVGIVAWGVGVGWNEASDAATFFQALVTIVAVVVGGGWALYVYVRSRASAAFVKVHLEKAGYAERKTGEAVLRYAVVGVTLENTGRRPLETALVQIEAQYFDVEQAAFRARLSGARVVDPGKETSFSLDTARYNSGARWTNRPRSRNA
jgi:hypothetical protein